MLQAAILGGAAHGFSTRGPFLPESVLHGAPLVLAKQVHSARAEIVTGPWAGPPAEADALVTATPRVLVGVVTADCAPVLLADLEAGVVGAAHAGWRGAVSGVLESTIAAMESLGARRGAIVAAIGPTIAQASYEVDARFRSEFDPALQRFFAPGREGHWQFDLPAYADWRLREAGIAGIEDLALDTYADAARFFSYRRATHRGELTTGRQTSVIALSG